MMWFKKFRLLICAAFLTVMVGCTQPYIVNTAIEYNKSLAQYVSEEILLNAVRASKRAPMSFSAIGGYTGLARKTGTISAFLPFSQVLTGGNVGPTLEGFIQDGTSFQNLNADEFTKQMKEPVSPELMLNFLAQDWPPQLIFSIFVRKVTLKSRVYARWIVGAKLACQYQDSSSLGLKQRINLQVCEALNADLERLRTLPACANEYDEVTLNKAIDSPLLFSSPSSLISSISRRVGPKSLVEFSSIGRFECKYLKFKTLLHVLSVLGYQNQDVKPDQEYVLEQEGQTIVSQRGPTKSRTVTKRLRAEKKKDEISFVPLVDVRAGRLVNVQPNRIPQRDIGVFELRSAQEMIEYLGQLVAAQNFDPLGQGFEPTINVDKQYHAVELFNVSRGLIAGAPVSITDDQGEIFSVPKPNYGGLDEDRSLRVISLIAQIVALKTVGGDLPKPAQTISITSD